MGEDPNPHADGIDGAQMHASPQKLRKDRILIIGGGIAGMALAIALDKQGLSSEIVEMDRDWTVYGAGITITGPTLKAFRQLGLLDAIRREGSLVEGHRIHLFNGTVLDEQRPPPIEPGLPASGGIMRPILHRIMSDETRRRVPVRLGVTVQAIDRPDGPNPVVTFSDGTTGEYDLVVGADGIYSKTRHAVFPNAVQPSYTGQMSWRVVAPRTAEMDLAHFYFGHSHIGGIVPCSQDEVYAFVLHPAAEPTRYGPAEQVEVLRALMAPFGGALGNIRDNLDDESKIVHRPFEYALQPAPWHVGRVVLIGDAAHATTPHLASGAGIAVEDGLVLAEELARGSDIDAALERFSARRFERCRYVVETSLAIGAIQLRNGPPQEIGMLMGQAMHKLAEKI